MGPGTGCTQVTPAAAPCTHAVVPFLLESRMRELGAEPVTAALWQVHAVRDGNLVTGQNPASAAPTAALALEVLGG